MASNDRTNSSGSNKGPLSKEEMTNIAPPPMNPGVRPEEFVTGEIRPEEPNWPEVPKINPGDKLENPTYMATQDQGGGEKDTPAFAETRGSGTDKNSDSRRLTNPDNLQDKAIEDTFPASDPPSTSVMTGVGNPHDQSYAISGLPKDFKDNPQAQFEYGRRSEKATEHFDRSSRRLEHGNPDVGEVDLGTIEADKPAQPDDHDHYDTADEKNDSTDREL